ncbi:MAG: hypothetical protein GSR79_09950, partial [Desulfurococcales archaeon]|nr:hypothetical protein [Desulfurococcales archaeon]
MCIRDRDNIFGMGASGVATKKVVIEVEVPEGVDMALFEELVKKEALRMAKVLEEWGSRLGERELTPGEERLLREIKRGVARRVEERVKSGPRG